MLARFENMLEMMSGRNHELFQFDLCGNVTSCMIVPQLLERHFRIELMKHGGDLVILKWIA